MVNTEPGYASPLEAMKTAPRETLLYVICVNTNEGDDKSDLLATVDVDPQSPTYCQIIHRLRTGNKDEIHHSGWNVCSSCHSSTGCKNAPARDKLILPALGSDKIFVVDVGKNPRAPEFHKVIDASEMRSFNCSVPHTTHCLATGDIMISTMGDIDDNGKCEFILVDSKTLKVKGTWIKGNKAPNFIYDFWYQPYHDVLVSSEWGAPKYFKRGFNPSHATDIKKYGRSINFFSWKKQELIQTIDLGEEGICPLEVRFLHNPKESQGYVGCAVNSNVYRFYLKSDGTWAADKVIDVPHKKITGWDGDYLPGMITDILLSLDDKYLYFSNWLHGDIRQYDITDRAHPKLTGQLFIGGKILSDSIHKVLEDTELKSQPDPVFIKGTRVNGGPQMIQLSQDGKRLYVTSSLLSSWDNQFHPELSKDGSKMVKVDIDTENGGMKLDENFLIDFGEGPDGPLLAHETRYPGGDCTSDIWLATD